MDKKGITVKMLLIAVLSVVFLVVLVFVAMNIDTIGEKLSIIIPGFGNVNSTIEDIEIIRYDVQGDKIEYYDGIYWYGFEGQSVKLGDKVLEYGEVKREMNRVYYSGQSREEMEVKLSKDIYHNIYYGNCVKVPKGASFNSPDDEWIAKPTNIFPGVEGGVKIDLVARIFGDDFNDKGFFILNAENMLEFDKIEDGAVPCLDGEAVELDRSDIGEDYDKVKNVGIDWRDSFAGSSVNIPISNGEPAEIECVGFVNGRYVVVDLGEPDRYCEDKDE